MSAKAGNVAVAAIVQKQLIEDPEVLAEVALQNPKAWRSSVEQHVRSMLVETFDVDSDVLRACVKASGVTVVGVLEALDWSRLERAVVKAVDGTFPEYSHELKASVRRPTRPASVHRTSVPPPSRQPLEITAANLYAEATKLPAAARFHRQVFLGPLLERFGTTPQRAKAKLWELHQNDEIELSRADLVDAMNPALVRSSEIEHHGARFHLLNPRGWS